FRRSFCSLVLSFVSSYRYLLLYSLFLLCLAPSLFFFFFFNDPATTEIYTLSLHDALPISQYERRLGEDAERVFPLGQHLEDSPCEPVLALGGLIRVGVGAHGDVLTGPAARRGLGPGQLDRVDLDHDLRLQLLADPETQVFVGG